MNTYAVATILGTVTGAPELKVYGETQERSFVCFQVRVQRSGREGTVLTTDYEVSVFNPQLFPVAQSLLVGQGVQVVAQITNYRRQRKDGTWFDNLGLTALGIAPGAVRKAAQYGNDNYGSGTYTPPANGKQAAQMPHDDEDDIPF